jgi:predicted DNA-binding protein
MAQREQLNIRLPPETFEILEAAAFLESVTVSEYVKDMIERQVTGLRENEAVSQLGRVRAEHAALRSGRLARLDERRGGKGA